MAWKDILQTQVDDAYRAAEGLLDLVGDTELDWKPSGGENWMSTGQLIEHLSESCGPLMRSFVTGEWNLPEGGMQSADKLPTIGSLDEARERLAAGKQAALDTLDDLTDDDLCNRKVSAPWDKEPLPLGHQLGVMVTHLESHKSQLFYYLKLMGKPVHTGHLWGM